MDGILNAVNSMWFSAGARREAMSSSVLLNRRDRQVAARAISPQLVHRQGDEQVICLQDLLKRS
ncbi:hypothetical protein MJ579_00235 [Klebsiella pneumoniae]|nr:hypothetical protein MJ579_00235 [Klebsiella pneumoniae]